MVIMLNGRYLYRMLLLACVWVVPAPYSQAERGATDAISAEELPRLATQITPDNVERSIILSGDSGEMSAIPLQQLARSAGLVTGRTSVVLMGDNIYFNGLPPTSDPSFASAKDRLFRVIDALKAQGANVIFLPGNHDWNNSKKGGWDAIKREGALIESALGPGSMVPKDGCPGPVTLRLDQNIRLIALDSEWWLTPAERPLAPGDGCPTYSVDQIASSLRETLASAPRDSIDIVASHHPLKSYGQHTLRTRSPEDYHSDAYSEMRRALLAALRAHPPRICAAGHDHSLQLIRGDDACGLYLVSGATSTLSTTEKGADTLFMDPHFGFMRLDRFKDGRILLSVVLAAGDRAGKPIYGMWLTP